MTIIEETVKKLLIRGILEEKPLPLSYSYSIANNTIEYKVVAFNNVECLVNNSQSPSCRLSDLSVVDLVNLYCNGRNLG